MNYRKALELIKDQELTIRELHALGVRGTVCRFLKSQRKQGRVRYNAKSRTWYYHW